MTTTVQRDAVWGTSVSEEIGGRDRRLLRFVARHGVVCVDQVRRELGVGRTAAYRRVAACIEAGLLERIDLLREEPSLLRATRQGLRYVGLGGLRVAEISPGAVAHSLRCTTVAQIGGEQFGHDLIRTERELVFAEQLAGRPLASAVMGRLPNRKPRLHRPDLVLLVDELSCASEDLPDPGGSQGPSRSRTQGGRGAERTEVRERAARTEDAEMRSAPGSHRVIAIEVELTPKSPGRLEAILRAWRQADCVWRVDYYCAPGQTRRAVERAAAKVRMGERILIAEALPR
jgi:hypothetical protein